MLTDEQHYQSIVGSHVVTTARYWPAKSTEMTDSETHIVKLPQGQIKGLKKQALYGEEYYNFEGIPFGKPPLGELRFKAPQPAEPWDGVLDCTRVPNKPKQTNIVKQCIEGAEDCLYLNVYAKQLRSDKPLPVMVWIYGGAFAMGGAAPDLYAPDYFMREDIILVEINYRVDSLGFLSLRDPELDVSGNAGLKDQVLALKWVKQYITHFNGDSNNITIFGESAGGASVHFMSATERTRGLFHKVIPMSACILSYWANTPQHDMGYRLAKHHGYTGENVDKLVLEYLQTLTGDQLVTHSLLTAEDKQNGLVFDFGPTVEPYSTPDCVVNKPPIQMVRSAWSNELPMMIGCTSDEGIFMYPELKMDPKCMMGLQNHPEYLVPISVRGTRSTEELKQLGTKLLQLHAGSKGPNEGAIHDFVDYYSHSIFWHDVHRTVLSRLAHSTAPTYLYRFNFDSPDFNHFRKMFSAGDPLRGVSHADDLSYLFFSEFAWKLDTNSAEFQTIQRMVSIWTAFAKNSDPNCAEVEPIIWKPIDKDNPNRALNISTELEVMELPEKSKFDVWDTLYTKENLC